MIRTGLRGIAFVLGLSLCSGVVHGAPDALETLRTHLYAGQLAEAAAAMESRLREVPDDDQARFGLGAAQFIRAAERLEQAMFRYGLRSSPESLNYLPFFRLPAAENPSPERLTYEAMRDVLRQFVSDLAVAEGTLAEVHDPNVKLPLNIGLIRLDMNGDGKITDDETLWRIYQRIAPARQITDTDARQFVIDFDAGDVSWLRAYCHLLMGLAEFLLAHDWRDAFEHTFHMLFPKAGLPYSVLNEAITPTGPALERIESDYKACLDAAGADLARQGGCVRERDAARRQEQDKEWREFGQIADIVAFVHLNHWPVGEPERMPRVLAHLEDMVTLSRESWRSILAETDNGNEWIPNPTQKGVIPGMTVTQARVDAWLAFLDEFAALLEGRKLLPHWRLAKGINVRRVFLEPATFDIVLWIQGSAAVPYLEEGEMTSGETWRGIFDLFQGDFFSYALWFN